MILHSYIKSQLSQNVLIQTLKLKCINIQIIKASSNRHSIWVQTNKTLTHVNSMIVNNSADKIHNCWAKAAESLYIISGGENIWWESRK